MSTSTPHTALAGLSAPTRAWFAGAFAEPTPVQSEGWPPILRGEHTLLLAPTGSGKTLAAFLAAIDRLLALAPGAEPGVRVLYLSPLKALAYDVERNLRLPLAGIAGAAERMGVGVRPVRVSVRTGDTPPRQRLELARSPGEILVTTPESLYLILASQARASLRTVETVIVDEIHALAPSKRGVHLALSLERLVELTGREFQRIGLSATLRPLDEVARFLGGARPVTIVDTAEPPRLDLTIEVPVEDLERPPPPDPATMPAAAGTPGAEMSPEERRGVWPHVHQRLLELVRAHQSTIIFTNSRRLCERLAQRLNELAGEPLVRAHHGSISRAQREEIEELLKTGRLRGIVATSSLELGIDMGAVELVAQVESPGAVARGLQRVGRAGHGVGRRSQARLFPKYRGDLLETAVVAKRMLAGEVEAIRVPQNSLDVLAQQLVAMCAERPWTVAELERVVGRAYSYHRLTRELLSGVLDMLAGRYPSDVFADLKPRLIWDRKQDVVSGRRDARLLAVLNAGTIPDRGLYGVHLGSDGPRVGELDEEMVYESRVGQTFLLGATSWRITEITHDRVVVQPAPGEPGRMPFWRGEDVGRPVELGRALGELVRRLGELAEPEGCAWLEREYHLDRRAARNLWRYVDEQRQATGTLPTDQAITIERFADELGDLRICILSPFGARVHAPWALALEAALGKRSGLAVETLWSDDGIVLRFADAELAPRAADLVPDPEEVEQLVLEELGGSALFASHFRENAARALLLPRRRPGKRTPLWSQRIRARNLLAAASQYPAFPIVLETYRECLQEVFDLPALIELLGAVRRRELRVVEVETERASPFARTLAFAYVAAYLYQGDAPLAERKAQALTLDRNLLHELLGQEELRDLLEPDVIAEVEAELQATGERRARHADALHDLLRRLGDLTEVEVEARAAGEPRPWLDELEASGRAARIQLPARAGGGGVGGGVGEQRWVAAEDLARYRDGLGVALPPGIPAAYLEPAPLALESLVARWARTHGPFQLGEVAARFGLEPAEVEPILSGMVAAGRLLEGEFRPGGSGRELCDPEVLRRLRRQTLARLRQQVAAVDGVALARFLPRWHGIGRSLGGLERLREAVEQLEGLPLPLSDLERAILPARVKDFQPRMLDELGVAGELVWVGRGALGSDDGRVALFRRDRVAALLDLSTSDPPATALAQLLLGHLEARGASFFAELQAAAGARPDEVLDALWDLVWAGYVTNDTLQPLRALQAGRRAARGRRGASAPGGRWSAVSQLGGATTAETVRAHRRALMLLERYGVVAREAAGAEALEGGFAAVAPVLKAMEEAGKIRRGYFVEGLTGAQYAHAGALDRLRAARSESEAPEIVVMSAVDPANAYGALLPWPDAGDDAVRPRRVAGAKVVLAGGVPVFYVEKGGRKLGYFSALEDETLLDAALAGMRELARSRRHRQLRIEQVNGVPALRSRHLALLARGGFRVEPGGLVLSVD